MKNNKVKKKILVVDDEKDIVDILKYSLEKEQEFTVFTAYNGKEALEQMENHPDLVLLDIMMPEINGFEVCKQLKQNPITAKIPVIFLTAKENEIDEILGLELGADDYIHKPLSPRKVIARIKSVIRRSNLELEKKPSKQEEVIKFKNLEVDAVTHSVKIDKKEVFFPKKEFQLLHFLIANRGRVFSREILLNQIWGENIYVVDRTVDVHVAKVREKLGEYNEYIETIKGLGYRFKEAK